jgi:hypothetical protein
MFNTSFGLSLLALLSRLCGSCCILAEKSFPRTLQVASFALSPVMRTITLMRFEPLSDQGSFVSPARSMDIMFQTLGRGRSRIPAEFPRFSDFAISGCRMSMDIP